MVLVHGFLDNSAGWRFAAKAGLADEFHLIAPDMRGHGDSDWIGDGGYYHFFDYVADLRFLISALDHKNILLVGHSMGGMIAGYYAGAFPESVDKLVLMEGMGPPESPTPVPDRLNQWVRSWNRARARKPHVYASIEVAADKLQARDPLLPRERAEKLATWGTRAVDGGFVFKHDPLHLTMGPVPYSVAIATQFWERIHCPILLIDGAESELELPQEETERRTRALASFRRECIAGAGHLIQRHRPETLAALISEFAR